MISPYLSTENVDMFKFERYENGMDLMDYLIRVGKRIEALKVELCL